MTVYPVQLMVTALAGAILAGASDPTMAHEKPLRRRLGIAACGVGAGVALVFGYSCQFLGFFMADVIRGRVPRRVRNFVFVAVIAAVLYLPFAFGSRADWLVAFLGAGEGVALLLLGWSGGGPAPSGGLGADEVGGH